MILQIGDKMPEFQAYGVTGVLRNNYEFADKSALAIVFTCNSCTYSKAYGQRLIKLFNKYEEDNLGIIGINSNDDSESLEDSYEEIKIIADKLGLDKKNFLYLRDDTQKIAKDF